MLAQLHEAIAQICPIDGVADLGEGQYRIDFRPEATPEQRQAAEQIAANFQLVAPVEVKWDLFRSQILLSPAYLRIVTTSPVTQTLNTAMVGILWKLGSNPALMQDVAQTWAAIAHYAQPTAQEIAALNKIGDSCNMPFRINEQGLMEMRA